MMNQEMMRQGSAVAQFMTTPDIHEDVDACLRSATIAVANVGPIVQPLIANLARLGLGTIRLLGDGPVTERQARTSQYVRWSDVGRPYSEVMTERLSLADTPLSLQSAGELPTTKLAWQEQLEGVQLAVAPAEGTMLFQSWIDALNEGALDSGTPWIFSAVPSHDEIFVGPTFVPGTTACFSCFEMRYKSHLSGYEAFLDFERHVNETGENKDLGFFTPFAQIAGNLLALEVVRALVPGQTPLSQGTLLTFLTPIFKVETDPVLPLPRCFACTPTRNAPEERVWR